MADELDLDAIQARNETAHQHIDDLCHGHKRWTMRIPARPDEDSDLVLSRSLNDVFALVAEVRRLRDVLQQVQELALMGGQDAKSVRRQILAVLDREAADA